MEPKGSPKGAKWSPMDAKRNPNGAQWMTKGTQRDPKGVQMEPNSAKRTTKISIKMEGGKRSRQGGGARLQNRGGGHLWSHFSSKINEKTMQNLIPKSNEV